MQRIAQATTFDRLLRLAADRVTRTGPPMPTRALTPLRNKASQHVLALKQAQALDAARRLRAGQIEARDELAAVADDALLAMHEQMRVLSTTKGPLLRALVHGDARWNDCDTQEYLDDPNLDEAMRTRIMSALDHFNTSLDIYDRFLTEILPLLNPTGVTRILDLAAGHGGFARAACHRARNLGLDIHITASDVKQEYLDIGSELARRDELPVDFVIQDALDLTNLPDGAYDIIICTQSLHHFPAGLVTVMFEAATRAATRGVVFIDLCRSALSAATTVALAYGRYGDPEFAHDAFVSTRRGFVPEELELLARLGCAHGALESKWVAPAHCLLRWRPAQSDRV